MRITIVIPVFNEARSLRENMSCLYAFITTQREMDWEIVIANNGSTDQTLEIASRFSQERPKVRVIHINQKGRGRALKQAWTQSDADVLCYMDADLSADLGAFAELVDAIASGKFDVATGSRLLKSEWTTRCLKREFVSRSYNFLVKLVLQTRFSDAQCGFKAISQQAARDLLPQVEDSDWFFDTELLVAAEQSGYRILDLPIRWKERRETRVRILRTATAYVKGLMRLRKKWQKMGVKR